MASVPVGLWGEPELGTALTGCVAAAGSRAHPYVGSPQLLTGPSATRNLADAIHHLCALHGRYPGIIELAAVRTHDPEARRWLSETSEGFSSERAFLARLAVAAGPVPATPGGGGEAMLATQRNAIHTLAQSERRGCAFGAALAFAADWIAIRAVLSAAAARLGVSVTPSPIVSETALRSVAEAAGSNLPIRRAMLFGAEQIALQHRGLWDVLQARAEARAAA